MDNDQWKEFAARQKKWLKEERRRDRLEKSKLYWIFDPKIKETHRIKPRDTEQTYQRANIRYFFSWEGLSKFLLAPFFKVGLTSIIFTPFIASIYNSFGGKLEAYLGINFPIQMSFLFFSGLLVVIARVIYETFCPKLLKAYINNNPLYEKKLHNEQWIQTELEYCLLQYVYGLPISGGYLHRRNQIQEMRQKDNSLDENLHTSPILELAPQRVGFNVYGMWLIENLLLRISKKTGHRLFVSRYDEENYTERESLGELWDTNYTALYHADFCIVDQYKADNTNFSEGDLLIKFNETTHHVLDPYPQNGLIHNYINGISYITELGANDVIKEFIAENQNYWHPFARISITGILMLSMILLLGFLFIQANIVRIAVL
jgi:hypothetical protein